MSEQDETIIGLRISQDEYAVVNEAIKAVAGQAKAHGRPEIYGALKQFAVRLRQAVFAGEGVPEETMMALSERITAAFAEGDFEAAKIGIRAMLAAVIRMDPDPAHVIAMVLAPSFMQPALNMSEAGHQIAAETMKRFGTRLATEKAAFAQTGWVSGEETFDYVAQLVNFCAEELGEARDPFAEANPEIH